MHICPRYTVLDAIGHRLPCNYNYSKLAGGSLLIRRPPSPALFAYTPLFLTLLAFIFAQVTLSWVKSAIGCHVITITRNWQVGPFPNFLSSIWGLLPIYTVNCICSHAYLPTLHCLGCNRP